MKKVLRYCVRNGYLNRLPEFDMLRMKKYSPEAHTEEEVKVLLESSKHNISMNRYLRLMLYTGIRPQEATALMVSDLNSQSKTLKIRSDNPLKKGRIIPLDADFCRELESWIKETGRICPYATTDGAQTVLSRLAKRLDMHSSPKKLRSTFASLMVQQDINPFRLAELMGNSIKILQEYYVIHNKKKMAEDMAKNPVLDLLFVKAI